MENHLSLIAPGFRNLLSTLRLDLVLTCLHRRPIKCTPVDIFQIGITFQSLNGLAMLRSAPMFGHQILHRTFHHVCHITLAMLLSITWFQMITRNTSRSIAFVLISTKKHRALWADKQLYVQVLAPIDYTCSAFRCVITASLFEDHIP